MQVNKGILGGACAFFVLSGACFCAPGLARPAAEQASANQALRGSSLPASPGWTTVRKLVESFKTAKSSSQLKTDNSSQSLANTKTLNDLIDYRQIAMRSMGKSGWQSLSVDQQLDMTQTIHLLVQNRYYPRWQKIFGRGEVSYIGQSVRNGDIIVASNLHLGKKDESLTWQLSAGPKPKVVSLSVDKNDLLTRLSQRIQTHRSKGGYPAMIAWLKGKGKVGIADGEAPVAQPIDNASLKTSARSIDLID